MTMLQGPVVVLLVLLVVVFVFIVKSVDDRAAAARLGGRAPGQVSRTLTPGLKIVIPFIDRIAYKHSLKEIPLDHTKPGLHHARQHAAGGRRRTFFPGHGPAAGVVRRKQLHSSPSRNSRRPRCAR